MKFRSVKAQQFDNWHQLTGPADVILAGLPSRSFNCCITSPPYFGLRDYGGFKSEIGRERTVEQYIAHLMLVFHQVYRVLRNDGTLFVVIDDSYVNKHMQLVPERFLIAMDAMGWIVRSKMVWHKPGPQPEGKLRDRMTGSWEFVYLFSKQPKYYFDISIFEEVAKTIPHAPGGGKNSRASSNVRMSMQDAARRQPGRILAPNGMRNKRDFFEAFDVVLEVSTERNPEDHFAAFPHRLIEPFVKAGCPVGGKLLDPFEGSGTTGNVAIAHCRKFWGIDINPAYKNIRDTKFERYVESENYDGNWQGEQLDKVLNQLRAPKPDFGTDEGTKRALEQIVADCDALD